MLEGLAQVDELLQRLFFPLSERVIHICGVWSAACFSGFNKGQQVSLSTGAGERSVNIMALQQVGKSQKGVNNTL